MAKPQYKFVRSSNNQYCQVFLDGILTRDITDPRPDIDIVNGTNTIVISPADGGPLVIDTNVYDIIIPGDTIPTVLALTAIPDVLATTAFFAPSSGTVTLAGTPAVTISGTPNVAVTNTPNVAVTAMPAVPWSGSPNVAVASMPAVPWSGAPTVAISGTPAVSISGTPSVSATISGTPAVTISGTPTVNIAAAQNIGIAGLSALGGAVGAASLPVVLSSEYVGPSNITTQNLNPLTGTPTAGSFVNMVLNGQAAEVIISITGTWTCTGGLIVQLLIDGTNWVGDGATELLSIGGAGFGSSINSAATGIWRFPVGGARQIRVSANGTWTGTATITITSSSMPSKTTALATVAQITSSIVPGVAATHLGKAKGNVAGATDTGVTPVLQRVDAIAIQGAAGQYILPMADKYGAALVRQYERMAKTYSATANIAAVASAQDIFTITGNASTGVYITRIVVSGTQTTAGAVDIVILKRSAANTGGSSTAPTAVPHDSGDAAASATLLAYTANPTPGALVGNVRRQYVPIGTTTSLVNPVIFNFGENGKQLLLSGVAQVLAVNLNGVTVAGGTFDIQIEWFEI